MNEQIRAEFEQEYKARCGHPAVWVRQLRDYNNSDTRAAWHFWQAAHARYAGAPAQPKVPDKMTEFNRYVAPEDGAAGQYYVDGWNDCREEILSAQENNK
jgi:hypothetical protein